MNFLMLTVYEDSDRLFESLKAGASGYLLKRSSLPRLVQAIQELHAGGSPMSPHIARQVVEFISNSSANAKAANPKLLLLTPAQSRTLHELAQGFSYKEIADHLGITTDGVRNHIRNIYEKLQVHSRWEAVNIYLKR
jgi:DNA-binding NarL/FixJ family response regulator